jgi:probable HAF family extracellular repeat protein
MASSPFFDAGIYIGGASRSCANSQLSPAWTTSVEAQGWGLIPLWPGPQAPCACPKKVNGQCVPFPHVFSSTPSVAETQGVAEASSAIAAASTLGLSGLVYYDMEQYSSSQCGPAVTAFVDGWVSQLHSSGFVAGVYGSAADAHTDWAKSSHVPDAVWIAKISKLPSATVWGLTPLSDTEWGTISTARIHQFLGNYSETWGKVSFTVDVDTEDGPVLNPNNGAKTPSYSFSSYDYPGSAGATFAKGVNDVWQGALINATGQTGQIVGGYYDSTGVEHGFLLDSLATWSTIDYPGQLSGEAEGINNSGQIVGVWLDTNECSHGYLYSGGAFTAIDNPNATCAAGGTALWGINDAGQITGSYCGASGCNSFLDYATKYYPITYTGAPGETNVRGINGDAMATGNVGGLNPGFSAFTSTLTPPSWTGGFSSFFDAAGLNTYGQGINNNGDVAGYYEVSNLNDFGLLFTNNVQLVSFQYPPGFDTYATGVNDFGQIVGYYHDSNQKYHVFVATP